MISKRVPIRKCIVCSERKPKEEFLMIVRPAKNKSDAELAVMGGEDKKSGRGYYICKNIDCVQKARRVHRLERLFSKRCNFEPEKIYKLLEKAVHKDD